VESFRCHQFGSALFEGREILRDEIDGSNSKLVAFRPLRRSLDSLVGTGAGANRIIEASLSIGARLRREGDVRSAQSVQP
jgi:hypothetical protein